MNRIQLFFVVAVLIAVLSITLLIHYSKQSNAQTQINITELDTLDRMRYTAIQMTVLDLEGQQPTNLSNDEIVNEIYQFQQSNGSNDRLTTIEIEELYRNITAGQ
jgi:signal transduction histidine kinase